MACPQPVLENLEHRYLFDGLPLPQPPADPAASTDAGGAIYTLSRDPVQADATAAQRQRFLDDVRAELPRDGVVLDLALADEMQYWGPNRGSLTSLVTNDDPAAPVDAALRVEVTEPGTVPWDVQVATGRSDAAVAAGDTVFGSVLIRFVSGGQNDAGFITPYLHLPDQNYLSIASTTRVLPLEAGWQRVDFWTEAANDYSTGALQMVVHLASLAQTVDVGGLLVLNLGQNVDVADLPLADVTYTGRSSDAAWRPAADARIDAHRKADLAVRVVDANGVAVTGASVSANMQSHAFRFGAFLGSLLQEPGTAGTTARSILRDNFNAVTAPIYWADWGWNTASGPPPSHWLDNLDWAAANGMQTRAHPILWPSRNPSHMVTDPWAAYDQTGDAEALRDTFNARIDNVLTRLAPYDLVDYDLVNETRAETAGTDVLGTSEIDAWFDRASAQTDRPLSINDPPGYCAEAGTLPLWRLFSERRQLLSCSKRQRRHTKTVHRSGTVTCVPFVPAAAARRTANLPR